MAKEATMVDVTLSIYLPKVPGRYNCLKPDNETRDFYFEGAEYIRLE